MTQLPRQEDRRVIPRWRETATAVQLGEANSLNAAQPKETQRVRAQASVRLLELQTAFAAHPSVGRAAELTGAATLLRQVDGAQDAAAFLLRHPHDTTPRVLQAARHILGQPLAEVRPLSPPNMDELAPDDMHSEVRRLRADLKAFDRSPMAHVDLARMYAALGATRKTCGSPWAWPRTTGWCSGRPCGFTCTFRRQTKRFICSGVNPVPSTTPG